MTNEQTLRCVCIAISKRDENTKYTYGYDPANPGYYYFKSDVYFFHNTEIMTRDSWMLPGILRDIAGAMGWYISAECFGDSFLCCYINRETWTRTVMHNKDSIVIARHDQLSAELAAAWQIMRDVYGPDYCAGIEREVCG